MVESLDVGNQFIGLLGMLAFPHFQLLAQKNHVILELGNCLSSILRVLPNLVCLLYFLFNLLRQIANVSFVTSTVFLCMLLEQLQVAFRIECWNAFDLLELHLHLSHFAFQLSDDPQLLFELFFHFELPFSHATLLPHFQLFARRLYCLHLSRKLFCLFL